MDYNDNANHAAQSHYEYILENARSDFLASAVKEEAFTLMNPLEGWCSERKAGILTDLILGLKPKVILEIGVWGGKSLIPMAFALKVNGAGKIYGIDPWEYTASVDGLVGEDHANFWTSANYDFIFDGLMQKIISYGLNHEIELWRCTSADAKPIYNIDILHVDGNHSDHASYLDVTKWVPLVKSGGLIIFDDMTWLDNGALTTRRAVSWLDEHCIKLAEYKESVYDMWGVWVKP